MIEAQLPVMRTRAATPADAVTAAAWMTKEWSLPQSLSMALPSLLSRLIGEGRIIGRCIEEREGDCRGWKPLAIGIVAFVTEPVIERYLAQPTPYPSLTVLQRILDGERGVLLDEEAVARDNAGDGLNTLTIYYGQTSKDPGDPEWRRVLQACVKANRELHGGYRLRRALQDEWSSLDDLFLTGGFRIYRRFAAGTPCPAGVGPLTRPRSLVGLTAAEAASQQPGTVGALMFEYHAPTLGLTSAEQRLLRHAVKGHTDPEIAQLMDVSPNTLKSAWRRIYVRCGERAPFVLEADCGSGGEAGRGPEKRRRVVAYVQEHLEELRPFRKP